ncbi:isoprenylcysteine carboxylmethyltransferase family protein [Bradyrhizobium sp. WSM 1738]|uniref:methyltransferase family protein n=1 Tax=Bradyrhizobium hereditatis TaxID=2821405 RepID=UPI001CE2564E|nr:isoprenylcysteine carboxylmethyltransferase family protein [Bradyrhizobium hereditatis]MCA6113342.1 isoprenylcysteine carboxylmethyltransferase family protein [Bradyrhizobium hereditatis]
MTSAVDPKPMSRTKAILYAVGSPLILVALVFLPAGRVDWTPGWIFIAVLVSLFSLSALLLARVNPMIYRARSRFQPGTKKWDLILLTALLPAMIAEIPLATLDAGRMGWSNVPLWVVLIGYVLLAGGIAVTTLAQAVNPFFEPGVRVQNERAQHVITSGPYRYVRHPGYAAAIAMFVGIPLALASWWGLLPAGLAIALLVVRTGWEDRLLQAELPGYADYVRRTRHKLVPGLW